MARTLAADDFDAIRAAMQQGAPTPQIVQKWKEGGRVYETTIQALLTMTMIEDGTGRQYRLDPNTKRLREIE